MDLYVDSSQSVFSDLIVIFSEKFREWCRFIIGKSQNRIKIKWDI